MAINIPSLFRDVIETPEQRQRRKLAEQAALIPQARGGFGDLVAPLVQATSLNIQQGSEDLGRSVGGMLGLDMRDTSQKVQDILREGNLTTPEGLRSLALNLRDVAPAQAVSLVQAADERELTDLQLQEAKDKVKAQQLQVTANSRYRSLVADLVKDTRFTEFENGIRNGVVPMERIKKIMDDLGVEPPEKSYTTMTMTVDGDTFDVKWDGQDGWFRLDGTQVPVESLRKARIVNTPDITASAEDVFGSTEQQEYVRDLNLSNQKFIDTANLAIEYFKENPFANTTIASASRVFGDVTANIEALANLKSQDGTPLWADNSVLNVDTYETSEDPNLPSFRSLGITQAAAKPIILSLALQYAAASGLGEGRALTDADVRLAMGAVGAQNQNSEAIIETLNTAKQLITTQYNRAIGLLPEEKRKPLEDRLQPFDVNSLITE
tara:strand:+ start:165 stop:1478 length:1314 start_codon:yes stop_codon:yes gene_type:complete